MKQKCLNCRLFGKDAPDGVMPGVTMDHRRCGRKMVSGGTNNQWRHPDDWCDQWMEKDPIHIRTDGEEWGRVPADDDRLLTDPVDSDDAEENA